MKDMKWIKTSLIAHRGLHSKGIPENSLKAFIEATKNGYDIELDLQLTKDDRIIVFHDNTLARLCGVDKKVSSLTYDELSAYTLKETSHTIPLFIDILDNIPSTTNLMIELKTGRQIKKLVTLFLDVIRKYDFQFVVQSFDPRIVRIVRKLAPDITRGYITKDRQIDCNFLNTIIKILPIHSWAQPDYYVYKFDNLPNDVMNKYKSQGIPILSYTVTSNEEMKFIKENYDNAVFEGYLPSLNKEEK